MPNPIKYSTGSESDALKKGNLYIGTGAVGKGPSDTTGYYQGPSVPSNGYVIYMNKVGAPGGLSYHSAANDSELISFTNSLAGESFTTVTQCFNYYYGQTDKVLVNQDYPADFPYIVLDGLVLYLDAGISQSYPGSGTVWTDINGLGPKNNGTLTNGPTFSTDGGGSIVFDGSSDYTGVGNVLNLINNLTIGIWCNLSNISGSQNIFAKPQQYWIHKESSVNKFRFKIEIPTRYEVEANLSLSTGQWYYVVGTYDNNNIKIYVNGTYYNSTIVTGNIQNTSNSLNVGAWINGGDSFNGKASIAHIYNRALTATEVLQNYNATKGRFGL